MVGPVEIKRCIIEEIKSIMKTRQMGDIPYVYRDLDSIDEIKDIARGLIDITAIKWGSVIYFPTIIYNISKELEELVPHMKNPLGAFVGLTFPVKYIYRTVQNPLIEPHQLKAGARTVPETVRSMLQNNDK